MFLCQFVCLWSLSFPGVCGFLLLDSYATFLNLVLVGLCINPFFHLDYFHILCLKNLEKQTSSMQKAWELTFLYCIYIFFCSQFLLLLCTNVCPSGYLMQFSILVCTHISWSWLGRHSILGVNEPWGSAGSHLPLLNDSLLNCSVYITQKNKNL